MSRDGGFRGSSGDGDFSSFLVKSGDFAGVMGFAFSDSRVGVLLMDNASGVLSV
jgi:hypothetical protein